MNMCWNISKHYAIAQKNITWQVLMKLMMLHGLKLDLHCTLPTQQADTFGRLGLEDDGFI